MRGGEVIHGGVPVSWSRTTEAAPPPIPVLEPRRLERREAPALQLSWRTLATRPATRVATYRRRPRRLATVRADKQASRLVCARVWVPDPASTYPCCHGTRTDDGVELSPLKDAAGAGETMERRAGVTAGAPTSPCSSVDRRVAATRAVRCWTRSRARRARPARSSRCARSRVTARVSPVTSPRG